MKNIFLILTIFAFSTRAMNEETLAIPNSPHYDAALKQFTMQPLMLKTIASKQVAKNVAATYFEKLSGENIDAYAQEIDTIIIPDLQPLVARYAIVEAAQAGYVFGYTQPKQPKCGRTYEGWWRFDRGNPSDTVHKVIFKYNDYAQEFTFDEHILYLVDSPQQKMVALIDGPMFKFFVRKDYTWKFLAETPSTNTSLLFLDDATALSSSHNDNAVTLGIYSVDNDTLLTSHIKNTQKFYCRNNDNIPLAVVYNADKHELQLCYKKNSHVTTKELRSWVAEAPPSNWKIFSSQDKKNIALSFHDYTRKVDNHTILLCTMIKHTPILISSLNHRSGNIKALEDGFISLKGSYKLHRGKDTRHKEHYAIDIETEIMVTYATKKDAESECKKLGKTMTNIPLKALFASVALKNSDDPKALQKLKESDTFQNLEDVFKINLLEKIETLLKDQPL